MLQAVILLLAQVEDKKADSPDALTQFLQSPLPLLVMMVAAFYFLMIRPMRQRERQQRELLFTTLKKNDKVLTNAGIIGIVADLKDDEAVLKIDESANVRMRILRSSIVRILTPKEQGKEASTDGAKE